MWTMLPDSGQPGAPAGQIELRGISFRYWLPKGRQCTYGATPATTGATEDGGVQAWNAVGMGHQDAAIPDTCSRAKQ